MSQCVGDLSQLFVFVAPVVAVIVSDISRKYGLGQTDLIGLVGTAHTISLKALHINPGARVKI